MKNTEEFRFFSKDFRYIWKNYVMRIERENNEIKISFSEKLIDINEIQSFIDFIRFREINSKSKASQEDADNLSEEINQSWWEKNKNRFE